MKKISVLCLNASIVLLFLLGTMTRNGEAQWPIGPICNPPPFRLAGCTKQTCLAACSKFGPGINASCYDTDKCCCGKFNAS
ncbi:hypothetical protein RND81_10G169800 [Saponaria officinalis]|uniref:Uncharacterized protein n=1 Tax=Saponaria officinalis TaxID=3572 RepID=A0AAW1I5J8_SAPOF